MTKNSFDKTARGPHNNLTADACVEEHAHEIFVVREADAVSHPRTMMVHFQHTLIALAAMMAAIRLRSEASLTHSHTSIGLSFNRC